MGAGRERVSEPERWPSLPEGARPFADRVRLVRATELPGRRPQRPWVVEAEDGTRFKLRRCADARAAQQMERTLQRLGHPFPRCIAREGCDLLVEFLEGAAVVDASTFARHGAALGALYGRVRLVFDDEPCALTPDAFGRRHARRLQRLDRAGLVDEATIVRIRKRARAWFARSPAIGIEFLDVWHGNAVIDSEGVLRIVDEEAVGTGPLGLGAAKAFAQLDAPGWAAFADTARRAAGDDVFAELSFSDLMLVHAVAAATFRHEVLGESGAREA